MMQEAQCPRHGTPNNLIGSCCVEAAKARLQDRRQIGHASGCVTINCAGCGSDFYSTDYSSPTPPKPAEDRARELLAVAVDDVSAWTAAHIRRGDDELFVGIPEALRAITAALTTSPAVAEAVEALTEIEHVESVEIARLIARAALSSLKGDR